MREFIRDVGGPVVIAELFVLAVFLSELCIGVGIYFGDFR